MTKRFYSLVALLCVVAGTLQAQNIFTVSSAPGAKANFKTLQGAIDTVPAGSTLYLMPSPFNYGNAVLTKTLVIYGTGFFLGQNAEPNTQPTIAPVLINTLTFRPGSDNSYVEGVQLSVATPDRLTGTRVELDTVSNITLSRCFITPTSYLLGNGANVATFFVLQAANNCRIKQCYLQSVTDYGMGLFVTTTGFSGLQCNNNIIDFRNLGNAAFRINNAVDGGHRCPGAASFANSSGNSFTNNTFIIDVYNSNFANLDYTNNIFYNIGTDSMEINGGCSYGFGSNINLGGNNLNNISNVPNMFSSSPGSNYQAINALDATFVQSLAGTHSTDQQWMLQPGAMAATFGLGGTACGAFGGSMPYALSGIPAIPDIYSIAIPNQATAPGSMTIHIKARANN